MATEENSTSVLIDYLALLKQKKYRFDRKALEGLRVLNLAPSKGVLLMEQLASDGVYKKSVQSKWDKSQWQDVYNMTCNGIIMYIKFLIEVDNKTDEETVVVFTSFKLK